jgi:CRP/FNR family transcriptional regulator
MKEAVTSTLSAEALRRVEPFEYLDPEELELLRSIASVETLARRQCIYFPEDTTGIVFLLLAGKVRVARLSRQGKEITLAILSPGTIFGEQGLCGARARGALAEVLEEATVAKLPLAEFAALVQRNAALAYRFARLQVQRRHEIETRIEELTFWDVPTRLARLLVRLADSHGDHASEGILIDLPLTHQEVANLIGATRETTTAMLNDLRRNGMLRLGRKRIVITDRERLVALTRTSMRANGDHPGAARHGGNGGGAGS